MIFLILDTCKIQSEELFDLILVVIGLWVFGIQTACTPAGIPTAT